MLPGSAGLLPGYTTNLRNSLSGVLLGYSDLAKRFKFAVPRRGAGVSDPVRSPTGPGGVSPPYLPAGPGETVEPLAQKGRWRTFSDFLRFFAFVLNTGEAKDEMCAATFPKSPKCALSSHLSIV